MRHSRSPLGGIGLALLAILFPADRARAQAQDTAIIHLKDGRSSEADIVSVGGTEVNFRLPGIPSIQKMPYTSVDYIEFARPEAWIQTMEVFEKGEYEKVLETFKQVAAQRGATTGFPAPGNFASLAQRRLIDCYRRLRDPVEIAVIFKRLDFEKLPPVDRELQDVIHCWALVGDTNWEEARKKIAETFEKTPDTNPVCSELNFLMGLIAEGSIPRKPPETEDELRANTKAEEEAIVQYGRALGIDAGADPGMAAAAMRQAIERLIGKEDREEELKAMVHMYGGLHGNGKLWDGADEYLQGLFAEKLEITYSPVRSDGSDATKGNVRARYIRIERDTGEATFVSLAEVQVMSGKNNIAAVGKAKQSSTLQVGARSFDARLAIDGKTAPNYDARTLSRTQKEKNPWWELDLGTMKPIEEIVLFNGKGNGGEFFNPPGAFRILLLDGTRTEVFKKEGEPSPEPTATIKVAKKASKVIEEVEEDTPAAESGDAAGDAESGDAAGDE